MKKKLTHGVVCCRKSLAPRYEPACNEDTTYRATTGERRLLLDERRQTQTHPTPSFLKGFVLYTMCLIYKLSYIQFVLYTAA